jgi:hypothetical protein
LRVGGLVPSGSAGGIADRDRGVADRFGGRRGVRVHRSLVHPYFRPMTDGRSRIVGSQPPFSHQE